MSPSGHGPSCAGLSGLHVELTTQRPPSGAGQCDSPRRGDRGRVASNMPLPTGHSVTEALARGSMPTPRQLTRSRPSCYIGSEMRPGTTSQSPGARSLARSTPSSSLPRVRGAPVLSDLYLSTGGSHERSAYANDPDTNSKISEVRQWLAASTARIHGAELRLCVLEEFPLTSSGKTDRKALPEPVFSATTFRSPQTPTGEDGRRGVRRSAGPRSGRPGR